MFKVEEGGVSTPIKWGKENLISDSSIIVLDEENLKLWLWHGKRQNLVSRRVALRQAEALKGHGYQFGKFILGRDIKQLIEIDERKIGRDPETDAVNEELQKLLDREYQEIGDNIISFTIVSKEKPSEEIPKPTLAVPSASIPEVKPVKTEEKIISPATEYEPKKEISKIVTPEPKIPIEAPPKTVQKEPTPSKEIPTISDARIGFVLISILKEFNDVWASKKDDGSIAVEIMDGPVCEFQIEGTGIKFSTNSFKGIDPEKKTAIQERFIQLSKMLR
ncbi:hypothetical protein ES702_07655 [subsurface metagenome]